MTRKLALVLAVGTLGCGVQLTSGSAVTSGDALDRVAVSTTLTTTASRDSSPIVGVRSTQAIEHGIKIKNVVLHGGYDFWLCNGRFVLEPGLDLGAGGPLSHRYDGIGTYMGGSGSARVRVFGDDDRKRSFSVVFFGIEVVATPRYGVWFPPEDGPRRHVVPEFGFEGGLRFVFGSDIVGSAQGRPSGDERPGESEEKP